MAQEVGFYFIKKGGDKLKVAINSINMLQEVGFDFIGLISQHTIHSKINVQPSIPQNVFNTIK